MDGKRKGVGYIMLYTPKYILAAELDKKVCQCSECKKFRVLYNHIPFLIRQEISLLLFDSNYI